MTIKVGQGFDVHAFGEGDHVTLGGVRIAHSQGLIAHSDGDVLIHALCDALLGAVGLGDIGQHFPDTDSKFADIDSRELLRHVVALARREGYRVGNADTTVIAQTPKLWPFVPTMRGNLADDLGVSLESINVKATTTERLGFTGREEGVAAQAVVLLEKI